MNIEESPTLRKEESLYESSSEAQTDEEEEMGPEDLVDFSPVLRCLHIYTGGGAIGQFIYLQIDAHQLQTYN